MLYCLPVRGKGTQRGKIGLKTTYFYFAVFAKDEPNTSCNSVPGNQDWISGRECMKQMFYENQLCQEGQGKGYLEGDQKLPFNSCRGPPLCRSPLLNNLISSLWKVLSRCGNEYSININGIKPNTISPH